MDNVNHTFAVVAYGDSPYLLECIESVISQSVKRDIIITTSTPWQHIKEISQKYGIPLYINDQKPNIAKDWLFAVNQVKTKYFTLAHQDDLYLTDYTKGLIEKMEKAVIGFSNYGEIREGEPIYKNRLLFIKRTLLLPIRIKSKIKSTFGKKNLLRFGNPICCPSVMYNRDFIPTPLFDENYLDNLDWDSWIRLSQGDGAFVYNKNISVLHRIHPDSETTKQIASDGRAQEDFKIFRRLWPSFMAKIVFKIYKSGYKSNNTSEN